MSSGGAASRAPLRACRSRTIGTNACGSGPATYTRHMTDCRSPGTQRRNVGPPGCATGPPSYTHGCSWYGANQPMPVDASSAPNDTADRPSGVVSSIARATLRRPSDARTTGVAARSARNAQRAAVIVAASHAPFANRG